MTRHNYLAFLIAILIYECKAVVMFEGLQEQTTTSNPKFTCLERNAVALWDLCLFTNQLHPCFYPNEYIKMKVHDLGDVAILASQLCFGRVPPSYLQRSFCCFSPECLKTCYGIVNGVQMLAK